MWSKYATSSLVIRLIRDGSPRYLSEEVRKTMYTTRRKPTTPRFYDNSKGKIGLHRLSNRLECLNVLENWLETDLGNHAIRTMLKTSFNFTFEN